MSTLSNWYYAKIKTDRKFYVAVAVAIAPIVYVLGVGAVFVQLFKNLWTCIEDCWYSVGGTVSDINRYYKTKVFSAAVEPVEE